MADTKAPAVILLFWDVIWRRQLKSVFQTCFCRGITAHYNTVWLSLCATLLTVGVTSIIHSLDRTKKRILLCIILKLNKPLCLFYNAKHFCLHFWGMRDVWVPLAAPKNPTRAHQSKTSQVRVSGNERGTGCFTSGLSYAASSRGFTCSRAASRAEH